MSRIIGIRVLRRNPDGSIQCVDDPTGCCDVSGSGSNTCTADCPQCPDGTSTIMSFTLTSAGNCTRIAAGEVILTYTPSPHLPCRWVTDYGDEWEFYYDTVDLVWYLVGGGGEVIYSAATLNCTTGATLTLVSADCLGMDGTVNVAPVGAPCSGGGGTVTMSCCPLNPVGTTIYAHFSGGTGSCTCLDGKTVTLVWNGSIFTGDVAGCSGTVSFGCTRFCSYGFFGSCTSLNETTGPTTCSPFSLTDTIAVSGCCTGNITVLINTIP